MERKKNILDKIGSLIPGYRGYAERDSRRNCDKLLRNKISSFLNDCESILNKRINEEIKNKQLSNLQDIEDCRKKINTLADKIKYAPYGESSFFANDLIKEDELEHIYRYDHDMFILIDENKKLLVEADLTNVSNFIRDIQSIIDERNNFIKEHK